MAIYILMFLTTYFSFTIADLSRRNCITRFLFCKPYLLSGPEHRDPSTVIDYSNWKKYFLELIEN
jgi:hypothetical protein